jgi:uncharacterized membrane protein YkoI
MKKKLILAGVLAAAMGAGGAGAAFADNHGTENEAAEIQSMLGAKVTAIQAAQAAETKIGGKVASISFEGEKGKPFYEVEVVTTDGQQHGVAVDATSGEVTKMAANQEDEQSGENNGENEQGENGEED